MSVPPPPCPLRFTMNGRGGGGGGGVEQCGLSTGVTTAAAPPRSEITSLPRVSFAVDNKSSPPVVPQGTRQRAEATNPLFSARDESTRPPSPRHVSSTATAGAESSSCPSQRVEQLWQCVQDLTAENAVLQQRVRVLMEGETHIGKPPGMFFDSLSHPFQLSSYGPEEIRALLLRIQRLEAALKLEAMEREALEVKLQAQEHVLTRLIRR